MQVTEWFPAAVKPIRVGDYEVRRNVWVGHRHKFMRRIHRLHFDGRHWKYTKNSRMSYPGSLAALVQEFGDKWRGLANKP